MQEDSLTKEFLEERIDYNPVLGSMVWKPLKGDDPSGFNKRLAGKSVGSKTVSGHIKVEIAGVQTYAHRIAFFLQYNYWPVEVDHKDQDPSNNKIDNLRECSRSQNMYNKSVPKNNVLGIKNIRVTKSGSYRVTIRKKPNRYSRTFKTLEEALDWRDSLLLKLHGDFASQ